MFARRQRAFQFLDSLAEAQGAIDDIDDRCAIADSEKERDRMKNFVDERCKFVSRRRRSVETHAIQSVFELRDCIARCTKFATEPKTTVGV